jgi:hypothetical protein
MSKLWTVIRDNRNREVLWLVGGLAVVIAFASLWTTFDYFARPKPSVNVATGGGPSPTIEVPSSPIIMVPSPTIGWPQPSPPFGGNVSGETLALETGRLIDADKWLLPEPEFGALIPLGGENSLPNSGGNVSGETPALETGRLIDADKWLLPEPEFGALIPLPGPPVTIGPPTTPPVTTVDQALARLKSANVAFNTPDRARVAKPIVIEAKLSSFLRKQELKVLIEESGTVEVATLKVSDRMVATLVGATFDVSPTGPQEQWVSDVEPTAWTWQVTPKAVGENQVLILTFDAVISINGKDDKRTINTFKRRINVDVSWPETIGEWLELIKKTGENVSWIWVTVLIPIGGGAWAWLKARKRMSEANRPSADSAPTGSDDALHALDADATRDRSVG